MGTPFILIVGGGPAGLIAAWAAEPYPCKVGILEPGRLGGSLLAPGGLRYLKSTDGTTDMLETLDVGFEEFRVKGGLHYHGSVLRYPDCLSSIKDPRKVQEDHWRKTRRTHPSSSTYDAMNAPKRGSQKALKCDPLEFVEAISDGVHVAKAGLKSISPGKALTTTGVVVPYDYVIFTTPLWTLPEFGAWWKVPEAHAVRLNVVTVELQRHDPYALWDYVYTPYTPEDAVHRISPYRSGYMVEWNGLGDLVNSRVMGDLNWLFPGGYVVTGGRGGLNGHLLPLMGETHSPPENVAMLGRFAQWNSRATMDVVLEDAKALMDKWFG